MGEWNDAIEAAARTLQDHAENLRRRAAYVRSHYSKDRWWEADEAANHAEGMKAAEARVRALRRKEPPHA